MATSNITNAAGPSRNWADERSASAQSRYTQDGTDWAQTLFDAAQSQGCDASLTSRGSGDCGASVQIASNEVIPPGEIRYREFQKYGVDPVKWSGSQVNGTPEDSSLEARTLSQLEQLAALESAKASAQDEGGAAKLQACIDQLRAFWAAQTSSPQTESGGAAALQRVLAPVSSGSGPAISGALESNPGSQAWLTSILTAVRKVDPNASFSRTPEGGTQLNTGGTQVRVNPAEQQIAAQHSAAPTPMVNGAAPRIGDSISGGNCDNPGLNGNQVTAGPVQQASSANPVQPLLAEVLSPDPAMQAWYELILTAARDIDSNATIDNSIGIARVLVNGQQTILTGPMYDEFAQGYATPEQQVNRGVTGTPIAWTPEQEMRLAQHQIQSLNSSLLDLCPADAQRQFDAMRPSWNGVPGEASLSIGSQRFPIALQDGKIVLSGVPESWASIAGNPPPAGPSLTPGPRLVTYANGMQGYVGPDGTAWRDTSPTTPAWGTTPTPFDGPATLPSTGSA